MFNICKTIETSIIECINNNSFPRLLIIRTFEKRDPGSQWQRRWQRRQRILGKGVVIEALGWGLHEKSFLTQTYPITFLHLKIELVTGNHSDITCMQAPDAGSIFLIWNAALLRQNSRKTAISLLYTPAWWYKQWKDKRKEYYFIFQSLKLQLLQYITLVYNSRIT